jgi:hypothetical protein
VVLLESQLAKLMAKSVAEVLFTYQVETQKAVARVAVYRFPAVVVNRPTVELWHFLRLALLEMGQVAKLVFKRATHQRTPVVSFCCKLVLLARPRQRTPPAGISLLQWEMPRLKVEMLGYMLVAALLMGMEAPCSCLQEAMSTILSVEAALSTWKLEKVERRVAGME